MKRIKVPILFIIFSLLSCNDYSPNSRSLDIFSKGNIHIRKGIMESGTVDSALVIIFNSETLDEILVQLPQYGDFKSFELLNFDLNNDSVDDLLIPLNYSSTNSRNTIFYKGYLKHKNKFVPLKIKLGQGLYDFFSKKIDTSDIVINRNFQLINDSILLFADYNTNFQFFRIESDMLKPLYYVKFEDGKLLCNLWDSQKNDWIKVSNDSPRSNLFVSYVHERGVPVKGNITD